MRISNDISASDVVNLSVPTSVKDADTDAAQIAFRQEGMPYLTHVIICARKRLQQGGLAGAI